MGVIISTPPGFFGGGEDYSGFDELQVYGLTKFDWSTESPGLQINAALASDQLEHSDYLFNVRTLLNALADGGTKLTATSGNLNRAFVGDMLASMRWPEGYETEVREMNKAINEEDVWELHTMRVVLQTARLVAKRQGRMTTTRKGRDLADPARAGELFAQVFETMFRTYNLAYGDRAPSVPEFQHTIAFPLAVLSRMDEGWQDFEVLYPRLWLSRIADLVPAVEFFDSRPSIMKIRLIGNLERLGLLEVRRGKRESGYGRDMVAIRKAPLYDAFISLELGADP